MGASILSPASRPQRSLDPWEPPGHEDGRTIMISTHVLNRGGEDLLSLVDAL